MNNTDAKKTALITGATGFIGSHLVSWLLDDGWCVQVIIRPESNLSSIDQYSKQIIIHEHDGTPAGLMSIVEKAKPSVVFHLASLFLSQHESKDIDPMIHTNVVFGTQLVEAMITHGIYNLINTGTSWQHYENSGYNPVCLYAATKQAFESIISFYTETTPLRVITLKLFDTYGPEDPRPKLFTLLRKIQQENLTLGMSPGEQLIDLVYIDDVIRAYVTAANRLLKGETHRQEEFSVSSGKPIKLRDLVQLYSTVTNKVVSIEWGGRPYRDREVMIPWSDGKSLPGWQPTIGIEEGINRMENPNDSASLDR